MPVEGATLAPLMASLLSFLSGYNDKLTRLLVVCTSPLHCVYVLWHEMSPDPNGPKIGVSHPRPSAMPKACGVVEFSADIKLQSPLELAVHHSIDYVKHDIISPTLSTLAEPENRLGCGAAHSCKIGESPSSSP